MLIGCHMAMICLRSDNWSKIIKAYDILDKMHTSLPVLGPDPDLMYVNAMYHFSKAECFHYFDDFEQSMIQMQYSLMICTLAEKLLFDRKNNSVLLVRNLHVRCGDRMRNYIEKIGTVRPYSSDVCALCGERHPDKTGSHLVPAFLIKDFFPRFRELAVEENSAMAHSYGYVGRDLASKIDEIRGYELTDEERELEALMSNPLTRDNLFCTDCEHRFAAIENEMIKIHKLQLQNKDYECAIPYLFWLSVFFRMSVGKMSITLDNKVEHKIREILVNSIDCNGMFHFDQVDNCYYYGAAFCKDIRNELPRIVGTRGHKEPYTIVIGNLVLTFFSSKNSAYDFKNIDPYMHLNNGLEKEIWDELSFHIYWDRKEYVVFENAEYDMKNLGSSDICDITFPSPNMTEWNKNDIMIDVGDYSFLKGKYPFLIPRSLVTFVQRKKNDPDISFKELAEGSDYSAEELKFMMSQWAFREKRMAQNLQEYYKEHPLREVDTYMPELVPLNNRQMMIKLWPNKDEKKLSSKKIV